MDGWLGKDIIQRGGIHVHGGVEVQREESGVEISGREAYIQTILRTMAVVLGKFCRVQINVK